MIKIGDKVLCVDGAFPSSAHETGASLPLEGEEYEVEGFYKNSKGAVGIHLKGFTALYKNGLRHCYNIHRFVKPDISELENIIANEELVTVTDIVD